MQLIRFLLLLPFRLLNLFLLKINRVSYNKIILNGILVIRNQGSIEIGRNTKINSSKLRNIIGGDTRTSIIVKKGAALSIGEHVRMSNTAFYCTQSITIGNHVLIGGSTRIWDTDFHSLDPIVRKETPNEGFNTAPIVINDNAFIGGASIILKGVSIGKNSIIAAGSVVSKNVPDNEIWGGNPARFIRKVDSTSIINNL